MFSEIYFPQLSIQKCRYAVDDLRLIVTHASTDSQDVSKQTIVCESFLENFGMVFNLSLDIFRIVFGEFSNGFEVFEELFF